jgi:hypothetical protein
MAEIDEQLPQVIEVSAECARLAELPRLPVTVLVLTAPGSDPEGRRPLERRLAAVASDLGVGDGADVRGGAFESWRDLPGSVEGRHDVVVLRPESLPGRDDDPNEPAAAITASIGELLEAAQARFWVIEPESAPSEGGAARSVNVARSVALAGGPPGVVLPPDWSAEQIVEFYENLFERVLHDTPLVRAVQRATPESASPATVVIGGGRRHGLDLGRLLEDHRKSIDELATALRVFQMELAAAAVHLAPEVGEALETLRQERVALLESTRGACAEIDRDRDPAGWSRLAHGIAQVESIADGLEADRARMASAPPGVAGT